LILFAGNGNKFIQNQCCLSHQNFHQSIRYCKGFGILFVFISIRKQIFFALIFVPSLKNFIDILRARFPPISFCKKKKKKLRSQNVTEKSFSKHFCTKSEHVKCWWNRPQHTKSYFCEIMCKTQSQINCLLYSIVCKYLCSSSY